MKFINLHLRETSQIIEKINKKKIFDIIKIIADIKKKRGRIFFLGVGGSAGNASHAVNDFRKLCNIESYSPSDNVSELTARANDEGWETIFINWLKISKLNKNDLIFILSVGGGNKKKNISVNLIRAIDYGLKIGSKIVGIVGKDNGYTAKKAHSCVVIPNINKESITPHSESFQSVLWHLIISHPMIKENKTKW